MKIYHNMSGNRTSRPTIAEPNNIWCIMSFLYTLFSMGLLFYENYSQVTEMSKYLNRNYSGISVHFRKQGIRIHPIGFRLLFNLPVCAGNEWVYEDTSVSLSPGDTVNYWYIVVDSTGGHQEINQVWTVPCKSTHWRQSVNHQSIYMTSDR